MAELIRTLPLARTRSSGQFVILLIAHGDAICLAAIVLVIFVFYCGSHSNLDHRTHAGLIEM